MQSCAVTRATRSANCNTHCSVDGMMNSSIRRMISSTRSRYINLSLTRGVVIVVALVESIALEK